MKIRRFGARPNGSLFGAAALLCARDGCDFQDVSGGGGNVEKQQLFVQPAASSESSLATAAFVPGPGIQLESMIFNVKDGLDKHCGDICPSQGLLKVNQAWGPDCNRWHHDACLAGPYKIS